MNITIGTNNQKKVDVTVSAFMSMMGIDAVKAITQDAESGVPEAPHGHETFLGALNRAEACYSLGGSEYYVGLESGLVERYGNMFEEAWAVIISKNGTKYVGYSSGLMLPSMVVDRMNNGEMHNDIMASLDKHFNLPDDNRDTWSRYSGGNISRQISLEEAIRNALVQLVPGERNLYLVDINSKIVS